MIGGRQVRPYRVRKPQRRGFRYVFRPNKWIAAENIFGFYLPAVLVYASIESIQFSPLWVDGSR
jgi:hypothetical protein